MMGSQHSSVTHPHRHNDRATGHHHHHHQHQHHHGHRHPQQSTRRYAFESDSWRRCFPADCCVLLRRVFRQRDMSFVAALNDLRCGMVTPHVEQCLRSRMMRVREVEEEAREGVQPTLVYPLRVRGGGQGEAR